MTQTIDTSYMRLTSVLKEWMDNEEWRDAIEINDDRDFGGVATNYIIGGQKYQLYLEANELTEIFHVYFYSPFTVSPERMADMSRILNRINIRLGIGRFCCLDDGDSNPVQYKVGIDVDAAPFTTVNIDNMMGAGVSSLDHYSKLLTTVALTDVSADEAWSKFLAEEDEN